MAGNIIPAIATTNAIIAGVVVLHAFRVLEGKLKDCKSVYLRLKMNPRNEILVAEKYLNPPNPKCYVCAPKPQAYLAADTAKMTIKELNDQVLKNRLNMIAPDVMIDGKGVVVISSEEGETEENETKILEQLGIVDGTVLQVDDFLQNYFLTVIVAHRDKPTGKDESPEFIITADDKDLKPQQEEKKLDEPSTSNGQVIFVSRVIFTFLNCFIFIYILVIICLLQTTVEDEDDLIMIDEATSPVVEVPKKRKTETPVSPAPAKKRKCDENNGANADDDDICIIELDDRPTHSASSNNVSPAKKLRADSANDDCLIIHEENNGKFSPKQSSK